MFVNAGIIGTNLHGQCKQASKQATSLISPERHNLVFYTDFLPE